jgi:predicted GTPase
MSTENAQKLVLVSPVNEADVAESTYASRVTSLHGKRVGLLDNSKSKADKLLDAIASILDTEYGFADIVRHRKPSASKPVAPEVIETFIETCDLVIVGVGD